MEAVKLILRYLKNTVDYSLVYQGKDLKLIGYSDAEWAGDPSQRKSTAGYAYILNGGAISWSSKKQTCIALSTMEAEYIASCSAAQEAVWLRRFLKHLSVVERAAVPVHIWTDSMAALAYAKDPKYHGRTKHIEIK